MLLIFAYIYDPAPCGEEYFLLPLRRETTPKIQRNSLLVPCLSPSWLKPQSKKVPPGQTAGQGLLGGMLSFLAAGPVHPQSFPRDTRAVPGKGSICPVWNPLKAGKSGASGGFCQLRINAASVVLRHSAFSFLPFRPFVASPVFMALSGCLPYYPSILSPSGSQELQ